MKIYCKNCGKVINYKFNPFKSSSKIKCKNCLKVYKLKDINYNKNFYIFFSVLVVLILLIIYSMHKSTVDLIIRFILCVEFGDLFQYIFMVYSIKKHGFK